jgi:hypothetical protein
MTTDVHPDIISGKERVIFVREFVRQFPTFFSIGDGFITLLKPVDITSLPAAVYQVIEITPTHFFTRYFSALPEVMDKTH